VDTVYVAQFLRLGHAGGVRGAAGQRRTTQELGQPREQEGTFNSLQRGDRSREKQICISWHMNNTGSDLLLHQCLAPSNTKLQEQLVLNRNS